MKKILLIVLVGLLNLKIVASAEAEEWSDFLEEPLGKVQMQGTFIENDLLKIEVQAKEISRPVLGTAFHLLYPSENLKFLKYEPGDFLERGGNPIYLVTNKGSEIIFGQTLKREDSFPVGDGVLANFYFEITGKKEFLFEFKSGTVSTLETVRQDLDMVKWINLFMDEEKQTLISQDDQLDFLNESKDNVLGGSGKEDSNRNLFAFLGLLLAVVAGLGIYLNQKSSRQKRTA